MAKKQDKADDAPDFIGDGFDEYGGTNLDLPDFGVGGNIFTIPVGGLLAQGSIIGADAGTPGSLTIGNLGSTPSGASSNLFTGISTTSGPSFGDLLNTPANLGSTTLSGVGPTFTAPATSISFGAPGAMTPTNISLGDLINPYAQRTDITQLAPGWGTWNPATDVSTANADLSGVTLQQQPVSNIFSTVTGAPGTAVTTTAASDVTTLPAVTVSTTPITPQTMTGQIVQPTVNVSGAALGGSVSTEAPGVTVMDPFQVTDTTLPRATLNLTPQTQATTTTGGAGTGTSSDVTTLPAVTVTGTRDTTPTMSTTDMTDLFNKATTAWGTQPGGAAPVTLPAVTATTTPTTPTGSIVPTPTVTTSTPTITPPSSGVIVPPQVTVPPPTTTPPPTTITPTTTPTATTVGPAAPATPTTTTTSSAMNQRDLKAELEKTMAAFNEYRPQIQQMYGDLYSQFMPKGLTAAESGIINQYQADLARLQQRQAGMLSPEDIRQSQQSAREAYGARGQVMGPGAIGAEILNREAIRQQREDQARAALQASYGNVLNMANLQTGNLFSPIASLMSSTFNPLGAYPADVYGTNVNAQLARDIAQKNYEAAIRSAELSGAAQKQAATTSAAGNVFGPALGAAATKGISAIFATVGIPPLSCMPGDQCIDTPTGPKAVKDLKGGDQVIGYDGNVAYIAQACSWNQDPLRTFLTITREDGSSFTVCDDHKVMGIPAMEWVEGAELAGSKITSIKPSTGLLTSYDILTNQGGYRINGVPVNSMIPEIIMQVVEFHRQVDRNLQAASA